MDVLQVIIGTPWPSTVFLLTGIITMPLYLVLLITILLERRKNDRYRSVYYNLVLAQGLADFLSIASYGFQYVFRTTCAFNDFYWEIKEFIGPFSFNSNHYFMFVRCFGDLLVALQRFIVLCYATSLLNSLISKMPLFLVLLLYWIPPTLVSLPVILNFNKTLDAPETVRTLVPPDHQKFTVLLQLVFQLISFSISAFAYSAVIRLILRNKQTRGLTRETRLSLIVLAQSVGFAMTVVFYVTQYISVNWEIKVDLAFAIRDYFPLLTGFKSYLNPWLHLILNKDLRQSILSHFCCRKTHSPFFTSETRSRNSQPSFFLRK